MLEQRLIDQALVLEGMIRAKKEELTSRIIPLIQEFTRQTGLLVRSIEPGYVEVTTMEDRLRQFIISSAQIHVDVDLRGMSNRIRE